MTTENDDFFEAPKGIKALLKEVSSIEKDGVTPIPQNDEPGEDAPPQDEDLGLDGGNEEPPVTGRTAARRAETLPMGGGNSNPPPEPPKPFKIESLTSGLLEIRVGPRLYSVMGFNLRKLGSMAVVIKLEAPSHEGPQGFHLAEVNLAKARSRNDWVHDARELLIVPEEELKKEIIVVSQAIEWLQRENLKKIEDTKAGNKVVFTYSPQEAGRVRRWAESKDFTERLDGDCETLGYTGDKCGKLLLYLGASSRKLDKPISILSISKSGAGKSHSHGIIASLICPGEILNLSRISSKALSHFESHSLRNKVIFLDEFSGMESSLTPVRSLLSKGFLTIASPTLEQSTGTVITREKTIHGPISLFASTVNVHGIGDELLNRFISLSVPYDENQNAAIMKLIAARGTKRGLLLEPERQKVRRNYQVMQKMIRPLLVSLPNGLSPSMAGVKEIRRFNNLLSLTKSIALVRQFQRKIHREEHPVTGEVIEIIEAENSDLELARNLLGQVFLTSNDELSPLDKNLLTDCLKYCKAFGDKFKIPPGEVTFSKREVRKLFDWQWEPSKRSFARLLEGEYLIRVSGRERSRLYYRIAKDLIPLDWNSETEKSGTTGGVPVSGANRLPELQK